MTFWKDKFDSFQGHSPRITPTKYRPDGGDRYIPIRQSSAEWATR